MDDRYALLLQMKREEERAELLSQHNLKNDINEIQVIDIPVPEIKVDEVPVIETPVIEVNTPNPTEVSEEVKSKPKSPKGKTINE